MLKMLFLLAARTDRKCDFTAMKTTRILLTTVTVLSMAVTVGVEEAELGFVLDMTYVF